MAVRIISAWFTLYPRKLQSSAKVLQSIGFLFAKEERLYRYAEVKIMRVMPIPLFRLRRNFSVLLRMKSMSVGCRARSFDILSRIWLGLLPFDRGVSFHDLEIFFSSRGGRWSRLRHVATVKVLIFNAAAISPYVAPELYRLRYLSLDFARSSLKSKRF